MDAETDRDREPTAAEEAAELDRVSSPPTTGGMAPGGAQTGLRRAEGYPVPSGEGTAGALGGAMPTAAGGGSGTGAGGLATGPGGAGGTSNIPHGAGRPAYGTTETDPPDPESGSAPGVDLATPPSTGTTQGSATT